MIWSERQDSQDEEVERALEEIGLGHAVLSNDEGTIRVNPERRQAAGPRGALSVPGVARVLVSGASGWHAAGLPSELRARRGGCSDSTNASPRTSENPRRGGMIERRS